MRGTEELQSLAHCCFDRKVKRTTGRMFGCNYLCRDFIEIIRTNGCNVKYIQTDLQYKQTIKLPCNFRRYSLSSLVKLRWKNESIFGT
jgi:hypothetical protein